MEQNEVLLQLILDALKSVKDSAIGEGNFGIVVDKFPSRAHFEICAKYHKFIYDPREYEMLSQAHELGLPVPKPLGEWPKYKVFAMKRVIGRTLKELEDYKFSEDVAESIKDAMEQVCRHFIHGDLTSRNVMLEDVVIENGVITGGDPYIIDFGRSQMKKHVGAHPKGLEYEGVMNWLSRRVPVPA